MRLNGALINEFTSTDPARDLSASRLGIQNHGTGDEVYFRDIQVKEHAAPPFEPPGCDEPGSVDPDDDFDGAELDGCRWNRVVRPDDAGRAVEGGALHLETSYADIFAADNTPVTNMVLQDAPDGDWVAETKVTVPLEICCQQAGLIAYLDDGNYVKWDAIADPGMDQARLELRSEIDDIVQEPQEDVWVDYPEDGAYWLRLAKEGDTYSSAYSLDGESWTDFPAAVENAAIADGGAIGPFVLGIFQDDPIWAAFDRFTLAGDEAALSISVTPKKQSVNVGEKAKFTARVRNAGAAPAAEVRVCAKGPKRKVKILGKACAVLASLGPGGTFTPRFKLEAKRSARGERVEVKFTATSLGTGTEPASATLRVRR